jgi:FAD/FMN-containing dehydrogenase
VVIHSDSTFANSQHSYWAIQESGLVPSCIVVPSTISEVSDAISIISNIDSCSFAVKGGGHGTVVGSANINEGVKIDMSQLDKIETNSEGTVTRVGAGSKWGAVYEYLDSKGLSVAGGRNGDVGVSGLLLGGSY